MKFKELVTSDQRLVILRTLFDSPGYEANESILDTALDLLGHNISRDAVKTHMAWLEEQGLITIREAFSTQVATLTQRGEDVATGQAIVPGVKRPRAR
ncbi:VpaChn25_0724 family phage protein [Vibrio parahaemolyticus]|uniref:VpaChn25_0724 family phage protein n=1 Tax=Vibrio parahaemolyticus TaxID=670 RepID=UPI0038915280